MLPTLDQEVGFESRQNSSHDLTAFHCTELFIITLPSSRYDLNNVERDLKHPVSIINILYGIKLSVLGCSAFS